MTGDEYEYCVMFNPQPQLVPLGGAPHLVRTQWGSFTNARIFYSYAVDESKRPQVLRRLKPGPEEEVTINA